MKTSQQQIDRHDLEEPWLDWGSWQLRGGSLGWVNWAAAGPLTVGLCACVRRRMRATLRLLRARLPGSRCPPPEQPPSAPVIA